MTEPDARELAAALGQGPVLVLNLDASQAFIVASALQLAIRHPSLANDSTIGLELRAVVKAIGLGLGPNIATLLERGYDAEQDVPIAGDPLGLERCVVCNNAFEYDADPAATEWWHRRSATGDCGFICRECASALPPQVEWAPE